MNSAKRLGSSLLLLSLLADNPSIATSQTTTISDLPNETLEQIFSNLNVQSLKSAAQVSKQFNEVACELFAKEREAVDTFCSLSTSNNKDDEIVKAAKKVLSINITPAAAKIEAIGTLDWLEATTPDQNIDYYDQFVTLWDNNTFAKKDVLKHERDAHYNYLQRKAKEISNTGATGLSQKSIAILKKYE